MTSFPRRPILLVGLLSTGCTLALAAGLSLSGRGSPAIAVCGLVAGAIFAGMLIERCTR